LISISHEAEFITCLGDFYLLFWHVEEEKNFRGAGRVRLIFGQLLIIVDQFMGRGMHMFCNQPLF